MTDPTILPSACYAALEPPTTAVAQYDIDNIVSNCEPKLAPPVIIKYGKNVRNESAFWKFSHFASCCIVRVEDYGSGGIQVRAVGLVEWRI